MGDVNLCVGNDLSKKVNIICLIAAIFLVLLLPLKKEIWYDETVSVLCSKGVSHDTHLQFADTTIVHSADIEKLNNAANVFTATVNDNANSFLYNLKLHWITRLFGRSITAYMLLSKLCAVITLIAFYFLSRQFFKDSLFTGLAVLLLVTDLNFISMSHEIRAYSMGTTFVTLAAVFFFSYLNTKERPVYLFLVSFFGVCAVLSHFLTVYIIAVFLVALILLKGKKLFTFKNMAAGLIPLIPRILFCWEAYSGIGVMKGQSRNIEDGYANYGFHISEVFLRSMKYMSMNFKMVFPAFSSGTSVVFISFLVTVALFVLGFMGASDKNEKTTLKLMFALGTVSTVLLLLLSLKSGHYTSLYFRYHSFALPFCSLAVVYVLFICFNSHKVNRLVKYVAAAVIVLPSLAFFAKSVFKESLNVHYNHPSIAAQIVKNNLNRVGVPDWQDAFLLQSLLPQGYKIDYFRSTKGDFFILYKQTGTELIPAIKD